MKQVRNVQGINQQPPSAQPPLKDLNYHLNPEVSNLLQKFLRANQHLQFTQHYDRDSYIYDKHVREQWNLTERNVRDQVLNQLGLYRMKGEQEKDQLYKIVRYVKYPVKSITQAHRNANKLGPFDVCNKFNQLIRHEQQLIKQQKQKNSDTDINTSKTLQKQQKLRKLEQQSYQFCRNVSQNLRKCACCQQAIQEQNISICTQVEDVNNVGMSVKIFFKHVWYIGFLLLLCMFVVVAAFSTVSNIVCSNKFREFVFEHRIIDSLQIYQTIDIASIQPTMMLRKAKNVDQSTLTFINIVLIIQLSLGVVLMILWTIFFLSLWRSQIDLQQKFCYETSTAANYALYFYNMPNYLQKSSYQQNHQLAVNYSQELQHQLNLYRTSYRRKLEDQAKKVELIDREKRFLQYAQEQIRISNIIIVYHFQTQQSSIFDDPRISQINNSINKLKDTFIEWLYKARNAEINSVVSAGQREVQFRRYQELTKTLAQHFHASYNQLRVKKKQQVIKKDFIDMIVVFQSMMNKQLVRRLGEIQFSYNNNPRNTNNNNNPNPKISIVQAPQPEDVILVQLPRSQRRAKICRMFLLYILIIIITAAIKFLSNWGYELSKFYINEKTQFWMSEVVYLISVSIVLLVNCVCTELCKYLTEKEDHLSKNKKQVSLGIKTTILLVLNSIILPMIVDYVSKKTKYTNSNDYKNLSYYALIFMGLNFVYAIVQMADLIMLVWNLVTGMVGKFARQVYNCLVRGRCVPKNWEKLGTSQLRGNYLSERYGFQIGSQYAKIINDFLFVCFFCPLQPIVVLIYLLYFYLFYLIQKFILYKQSKRPIPGFSDSNRIMFFLCHFGPITYSIGWLIFTQFAVFEPAPAPTSSVLRSGLVLKILFIILVVISVIVIVFGYLFFIDDVRVSRVRYSSYVLDRPFFKRDYEDTIRFFSMGTRQRQRQRQRQKQQKILQNQNNFEQMIKIYQHQLTKNQNKVDIERLKRLYRLKLAMIKQKEPVKNFYIEPYAGGDGDNSDPFNQNSNKFSNISIMHNLHPDYGLGGKQLIDMESNQASVSSQQNQGKKNEKKDKKNVNKKQSPIKNK